MNIDSILQFLQENRTVVGYLIIGSLFLILLVFLFIKSITTSKQPNLEVKASMEQKNVPYLMSEQPDTKVFIEQLKKVSEESQKVIHKLDVEIAGKENVIAERTEYIRTLEQQIAETPMEQMLMLQSEKLKKENDKKLAHIKQQSLSRAYQMLFLGFIIGFFIAAGMAVAYYFVVIKG